MLKIFLNQDRRDMSVVNYPIEDRQRLGLGKLEHRPE